MRSRMTLGNKKKNNNLTVIVLVALVVIYLLLFWRRLLMGGVIPFHGDTIRFYYPSWVIGKNLLVDGFHFLWDPFRNMGQPFLAAPQNQALYPIRFLSPFLNYLDFQRVSENS